MEIELNVGFTRPRLQDDPIGLWSIQPLIGSRLAAGLHSRSEVKTRPPLNSYRVLNGVAVIPIVGIMTKHGSLFGNAVSMVEVRDLIQDARDSDKVKAIVLLIDSPGGIFAGVTELVADVAAASKVKPTIAFIEDNGAGEAYIVAAQCREVFANQPTAITGAVGLLAVKYDYSKAFTDAGIATHVIATGKHKGAGVPGSKITAEHAANWQALVDTTFKSVERMVRAGRRLTDAQFAKVAEGRMMLADEAKSLGLIDGIASFDDVMARARSGNVGNKSPAAGTSPGASSGVPQSERAGTMAMPGNAEPKSDCDPDDDSDSRPAPRKMSEGRHHEMKSAYRKIKAKRTPEMEAAIEELEAQDFDLVDEIQHEYMALFADGRTKGRSELEYLAEQFGRRKKQVDRRVTAPAVMEDRLMSTTATAPVVKTALEEFNERIDAKMKVGMNRSAATSAVVKADPALHRRVIAEANQPSTQAAPKPAPSQAKAKIEALTADKVAAGMQYPAAYAATLRENPTLRQQWIEEENAARRAG